MNAIKKYYEKLPESIVIPKEYANKKAEIIIIFDEEKENKNSLLEFYGSIPDFPERSL